MGCGSCSTGGCSPAGCGQKGGCSSGGCNKLNVYDWLGGMQLPPGHVPFNIIEVRFKGSRKEFFRNNKDLELFIGDPVVVEADHGFDIGHVSLKGELVKLQLKKYNISDSDDRLKNILRLPSEGELERYKEIKAEEPKILQRARTICIEMKLEMKLSDIELQGDRKKVVFFYTAEQRVDFRELIKRYAEEFNTRIDMRHIGYRQEAGRLGGIGSCGRELCCSTWLTDFKLVNISAARYQNLSLNPLKLQGQCGKFKCCLNYELDTYMDALEAFPNHIEKIRIESELGTAVFQKSDILKKMVWFTYRGEGLPHEWIPIKVDELNQIIDLNKKGIKPKNFGSLDVVTEPEEVQYATAEMEGSLDRLDHSNKNRNKKKKPKGKRPGGPRPDQNKGS